MLYRKNVPNWERALRIALSLGAFVMGLIIWGKPGALALTAGGIGLLLTGFFGFCPACALVGRKIKSRDNPD